MLPAILKTLHNLKRTKDITAQPAQQNIYIVCDLALLLVPAIMQAYAPAAAPPSTFPGSIPLPIAFFTPDESPSECCSRQSLYNLLHDCAPALLAM